MGKYLVKRLLLLIPSLFLVCFLIFAMMRMIPGDAVDVMVQKLNATGTVANEETVRAMLGMDKPFMVQFWNWLSGVLQGDLGDSIFQVGSVLNIIGRQLPVTLELTFLTLILTELLSIPLGLYCASHLDTVTDNIIRVIAVVLMSLPVFWIATLVLVYPAVWWGYAPTTQYVTFSEAPLQNLLIYIVPALLGAMTQAGAQMRNIRTLILEVLGQDYIRTAWAKGNRENRVLYGHALRNSMIPIITMIGGSVSNLIGGSVVLETMFNLPGIGNQLITALENRDYPLVMGCCLFLSIIVMVVNLIVDIAYKWVDPRVTID